MSAEAIVFTVLTSLVSGRVYPDVAPEGSALPRIVYQQVGGSAFAYTEGALPDKENGRMQIACWATTRLAARDLSKLVADAIVGAAGFQAEPIGARISGYEPDTGLYSSQQDFSIWSTR